MEEIRASERHANIPFFCYYNSIKVKDEEYMKIASIVAEDLSCADFTLCPVFLNVLRIQNLEHFKPPSSELVEDLGLFCAFPLTGGVEHAILNSCKGFKQRLLRLFVARVNENSLAAALETVAALQQDDNHCIVVQYKKSVDCQERFKRLVGAARALRALESEKLGVLGVSDWLVSCPSVPEEYYGIKERWGVTLKDIEMVEVADSFAQIMCDPSASQARELAEAIAELRTHANGKSMLEEFRRAAALFVAFLDVVDRHGLTGVIVRCFDLIPLLKITGCYALSKFNDRLLVGGCEGDIPASVTVCLMKAIANRPTFMANPNEVDVETGIVMFSHCTIASRMVDNVELADHFESGCNFGLVGSFSDKESGDDSKLVAGHKVTVARVGGRLLEKIFVADATLLTQGTPRAGCCRTQLSVRFDSTKSAEYFLTQPLGNHHVVCAGAYTREIIDVVAMIPGVTNV